MAQRGGGGHSGGGGFHGGGGFGGGGIRGGGGFVGGGFRGGFGGFRGGFVGNYLGFGRGYGWGGYYPYWGFGAGYYGWPGYYDAYDYGYPYSYSSSYAYPAYQSSPNVSVIYPAQTQPTYNNVYVERAQPVSRYYDQYGQEVGSGAAVSSGGGSAAASPIYLIAMKDGVIRAAASYWVNGQTLHYVTMEHQEKQAPLTDIDRSLSQQLNRERRVQFQLPQ